VLGTDVVVLKNASLFLGQDNDLSGSFSETLEHLCNLLGIGSSGEEIPQSLQSLIGTFAVA
jgi:hypothetical protein